MTKDLNKLVEAKAEVTTNLEELRQMVSDTTALDEERKRIMQEVFMLETQLRSLISENARVAQNQNEYEQKYQSAYSLYKTKLTRIDEINTALKDKAAQSEIIRNFISSLRALDGERTAFREELWGGIVDHMTVRSKKEIMVTFVGDITVTIAV
ncbi:MAG: hypothetical protein BACD_00105 [Bacteroides rodentium]